jgi:hypothetical protein
MPSQSYPTAISKPIAAVEVAGVSEFFPLGIDIRGLLDPAFDHEPPA